MVEKDSMDDMIDSLKARDFKRYMDAVEEYIRDTKPRRTPVVGREE